MTDSAPDSSPEPPPSQAEGGEDSAGSADAGESAAGGGGTLDPARMAPADAARALTVTGKARVSEQMIRADVEAGAPVNADGTINLVHYAAWLVGQLSRGERADDED